MTERYLQVTGQRRDFIYHLVKEAVHHLIRHLIRAAEAAIA